MAPVPEAAFRDLLAARSRDAFADFVVDLWAARGRDVERDGDRVLADDRTLVVVLDPDDAPGDDAAPAVDVPDDGASASDRERVLVSARPTDDLGVVGPAELRELLLYDVPRERAAALFERHFDRALDGDWPGTERSPGPSGVDRSPDSGQPTGGAGSPAPGDRDGGAGTRARSDRRAPSAGPESSSDEPGRPRDALRSPAPVVAVLFVALLVGIAVGAPGGGPVAGLFGGQATATPAAPPSETPDVVTATPAPTTDQGDADTSIPTAAADYPPGLSSSGVIDAGALGEAHARGVMGRSYTLTVTYREYHEGAPTGVIRETIRVRDRTVYVTDVVQTGVLRGHPEAVSTAETYADGSIRYERRNATGDPTYTVRDAQALQGGESPFAGRVERFVHEQLGARETRVVGEFERAGTTQYLVMFRATDWVGSARVDETGVVRELRWRFTPAEEPRVTAEVVVRYDFGPVAIVEPDWVAEARNATDE